MVAGVALAYREREAKQTIERFAAAALETLLNAIEANDDETGMHVRRVAAGALIIAEAMGLDEHCQRAIERVALFHDIGKIHEALFDIVQKETRLNAKERRAIDTHPRRGAEVLAPLAAFYPDLPRGVIAHHERWDGSGYPRGLKGRKIPLEARIVAVADTFDAVTHTRSYRRGGTVAHAVEVLAAGRGTQFDPEIVDLALVPPVTAALARISIKRGGRKLGLREHRREHIPDVSFRWRSESLGARRVAAPRGI